MRIVIEQKREGKNKRIRIIIPTFLYANRFFAYLCAKFSRSAKNSEKYGMEHVPDGAELSSKDIYKLFGEIKKVKKRCPKFKLVEVISENDDNVTVYL